MYSRSSLAEAWAHFAKSLRNRDHLICYAVKANSNLAILNVFSRLGAGFDIVSGGELQRVLAAGAIHGRWYFPALEKPNRKFALH